MRTYHNGFSLIELSIVLVILGLLAGGVMTGQALIRSSELRSVTTELTNYTTASNLFMQKYFALPGDMPDATAYWGQFPDGCPAGVGGIGKQTCNGNGDGLVIPPTAANLAGERYTFWQHLANAQMIAGQYTGRAGPAGEHDTLYGVNVPIAKLSGGGWSVLEWSNVTGNAWYFDGNYNRTLTFGRDGTTSGNNIGIFTTEEAYNIDRKIDDGIPNMGTVWNIQWDTCTDATSGADTTAAYLLNDTNIRCALVFRNSF